jgi:tol-pal system protein YbgF
MKRLLAYLFIVLGLGLPINSNSIADIRNTLWKFNQSYWVLFLDNNKCKFLFTQAWMYPAMEDKYKAIFFNKFRNDNFRSNCKYEKKEKDLDFVLTFADKGKDISQKKYLINFSSKDKVIGSRASKGIKRFNKIKNGEYPPNIRGSKIKLNSSQLALLPKIAKTQIAKAEPSQTQNLNYFQKGLIAVENENYSEANRLFEKFIKENPKNNKIAEVQYWYAETFRVRKLYTDAADAYLTHYKKYTARNEFAPQNLLKLGMMMNMIGEEDQGCKIINAVESSYPLASPKILNRSKYEAFKLNCPNARFIEKVSLDKKIDIEMLSKKNNTQIADKDANELEKERQIIAEEKRKIEEEKRKISEAKKKQKEEDKKRKEANAKLYVIGSGTGFFVSSEGHVVSNDHVVGICRKVATKIEGEINYFNVVNTDEVNDLGLIKGDYKSKNFLNIKSDGAEFGEDIVAFGYPLSNDLSDSVKLTRGIVSSLSGPGNNYSEIQIDAAIQPGNSGGPVLNMEGQVVGVASSGLNKITKLLDENSPYIPENVNFAVASSTLTNFLKANGVNVSNAILSISNTKELAKIGRPATLQLFCMNTKAAHEELKKKKKHSDVLLEKVIDLK